MNDPLIRGITDFIFVEDTPCSADVIFIPGGYHAEQPEYAASLYRQGYAPLLIPSGRVSAAKGYFSGVRSKADVYTGDYQTECEFLTDVLVKNGVPADAVLGENRAEHTVANARYTRELADRHGLHFARALIVCKTFHARRCQLLYQMAFPGTEIRVCPVDCYGITRENWYRTSIGVERVLGELSRCANQFPDQIRAYLGFGESCNPRSDGV